MENGTGTSGPIGGSGAAENVEVALDGTGGLMTNAAEMIEDRKLLDGLAAMIQREAKDLTDGPAGSMLRGDWLGHALHPVLTDLPIGFWTSAMAIDLVGGRHSQKIAKRLLALGIISSIPTAAAGLAEFAIIEDEGDKRVATVHLLGNSAAIGLFTISWWKRTRGHRIKGMLYSTLGAAAATASAVLGGHLVYNRGLGATQDMRPEADSISDDRSQSPAPVPMGASRSSSPTGADDFIDLADAAQRLGEPEEQVLEMSNSGMLPNRGGTSDQPRFRLQDVEAVRLMGG